MIDLQLPCTENMRLRDSFEDRNDRIIVFYCTAFHKRGSNQHSSFCTMSLQSAFIFSIFHKDMSFAVQVS
jgi:hypothetical protein